MGIKTEIFARVAGFVGGSQAESDARELAGKLGRHTPSAAPSPNAAAAPPLPHWANVSPGNQRNRFNYLYGGPDQTSHYGGQPQAFASSPPALPLRRPVQSQPRPVPPRPTDPGDADATNLYNSALRSTEARAQFEQERHGFNHCLAQIDVDNPAQAIPLFNEIKRRLEVLSDVNRRVGTSQVDRNKYEVLEQQALQKYDVFMGRHQGKVATSLQSLGDASIPPAPPRQLYERNIARAVELPEAELRAHVVVPLSSLLMDPQFKLNEKFHYLAPVLSSPNFSLEMKAAIMEHTNTFLDKPVNQGTNWSRSGPIAGPSADIAKSLTAQLASGSEFHPGLVKHIISTLEKCSPMGAFLDGEIKQSIDTAIGNLARNGQSQEAQTLAAFWSPALQADRERADRMYATFHN